MLIDFFNNWGKDESRLEKDIHAHNKTLIDLANQVLSIGEMKEKELPNECIHDEKECPDCRDIVLAVNSYNQAIGDLKELLGVK